MTMTVILKKICYVTIIFTIVAIAISDGYANDFLFDVENPKDEVYSPTKIVWNMGTLQIYDGISPEPIYEFKEFENPAIVNLRNGHYMFKRWIGSGNEVFDVNILEPVNDNGIQFDATSWVTVPGDGCKPAITDLAELYEKYGKYVGIDNADNPSQTMLTAYGKSHMDDNHGSMPAPYIMHNITYLRKIVSSTLEGIHVASYSLKIPSFSTGITAEGGLFVWSHLNQKNYGVAFQLIVDESNPNFGKIYYYGRTGGWIDSTKTLNLKTDTFN